MRRIVNNPTIKKKDCCITIYIVNRVQKINNLHIRKKINNLHIRNLHIQASSICFPYIYIYIFIYIYISKYVYYDIYII